MFKHLFTSRCADKSSLFSKCVVEIGLKILKVFLKSYINENVLARGLGLNLLSVLFFQDHSLPFSQTGC